MRWSAGGEQDPEASVSPRLWAPHETGLRHIGSLSTVADDPLGQACAGHWAQSGPSRHAPPPDGWATDPTP